MKRKKVEDEEIELPDNCWPAVRNRRMKISTIVYAAKWFGGWSAIESSFPKHIIRKIERFIDQEVAEKGIEGCGLSYPVIKRMKFLGFTTIEPASKKIHCSNKIVPIPPRSTFEGKEKERN